MALKIFTTHPMVLFVANGHGGGGAMIHHANPTRHHRPQMLVSALPRRALHVVSATNDNKKNTSSRTGRFDSKKRRSSSTTTTTDQEDSREKRVAESVDIGGRSVVGTSGEAKCDGDDYLLPKLPGEEPDFWEGPQWEPLGFFVQYLWAFGVGFALIACGIAVVTYNEGATDFKDTPVYKESVQSRELLEGPEESNADVFESNPTEVAPSLD